MADQFNKPLDKDITEYEEVDAIHVVVDPDTKKPALKKVTEKIPITVRYSSKSDPRIASCGEGKHDYYMKDKHKHIASCRKCPKNRFLRAVFETIKDGQIIDRATKTVID